MLTNLMLQVRQISGPPSTSSPSIAAPLQAVNFLELYKLQRNHLHALQLAILERGKMSMKMYQKRCKVNTRAVDSEARCRASFWTALDRLEELLGTSTSGVIFHSLGLSLGVHETDFTAPSSSPV